MAMDEAALVILSLAFLELVDHLLKKILALKHEETGKIITAMNEKMAI